MQNNIQNNTEDGYKVLVCGSKRFDDQSFVFGMLDALSLQFKINTLITSRFSGACLYSKQWAEIMTARGLPVVCEEFSFDDELEKKDISLYDQENIPDLILRQDPFFERGKNKILELNPSMVLTFPNPENELGAATRNIQRFSLLAGITPFDCSKALGLITSFRKQAESELLTPAESLVTQDKLVNRHPGKKF